MTTTPADDLDALLDHVLHHALEQLEAEGDFQPFGAAIDTDGELRMVDVDPEGEEPSTQELVEQLGASLAAAAADGEIRASAICANVTLPSDAGEAEAALVQLEHREDDPVDIALPYELHGDHLHTGELVSGVGKRRVFP
ncbi:MAG TPA: hypothetical protein VFO81_00850 [Gaiellaceae bacterium]|nr:hypothetical protein [Gaiellaceae bacterium]